MPSSLSVAVVDAAEMEEAVRRAAAGSTTPERRAAYHAALAALGVLPPGVDTVEILAAAAPAAVAGLYDPATRRLFVAREALDRTPLRAAGWIVRRDLVHEIPLVHELVHAIQHATHPELFEPELAEAHDDYALALAAAFEGHASLYGLLALELGATATAKEFSAAVAQGAASGDAGALPEAPPLVRAHLHFPYAAGYALALEERDAVLAAPPASTEQALHADRRRAAFEAIDLSPAHGLLPPPCVGLHENGLGELGIGVLLTGEGVPPDAAYGAVPAADGWDGDRYLAARCDGRLEFVWVTQWDTATDATEFEAAYRAIAARVAVRGELRGEPATRRVERVVAIATPGLTGVADRMAAAARRARVATAGEYRRFFGATRAATGDVGVR